MLTTARLAPSAAIISALAATTALAWGETALRSTQLDTANAPIVLAAEPESQNYDQWIDRQIANLAGDSEAEQNRSAQLLAIAVVDPPVRAKVLAALEPHLNSNGGDFRTSCVKAYAHWATAAQVPQLVAVLEHPEKPQQLTPSAPAWAAAAVALVRFDPKKAEEAVDRRNSDFFFHVQMETSLGALMEDPGPAQAAAYDLLKHVNPQNSLVQLSVSDAENLLRSDVAADRTRAATILAHAVIDPAERAMVLSLLKPHLEGADGRAELPYVEAFVHWAQKKDVPTLIAIVAHPKSPPQMGGFENCWAAATVALVRLDPSAAADAVGSRVDSFFYKTNLYMRLKALAEESGPSSNVAAWLMQSVDSGQGHAPAPADYDPLSKESNPTTKPSTQI